MNNLTEILCIIDKSGSMQSLKNDTIGGFNGFINDQRKLDGKAKITTVFFNSSIETVENGVDIQECTLMADYNYRPSGGTALLDAIGKTIDDVNKRLAKTPKDDRPSKIICVIITDGEENASRLYSREMIFEMIEHQTELHDWEFLFLGANQDAIQAGNSLGIRADRSATFTANSVGTDSIYSSLSRGISDYRSKGTISANWSDDIK